MVPVRYLISVTTVSMVSCRPFTLKAYRNDCSDVHMRNNAELQQDRVRKSIFFNSSEISQVNVMSSVLKNRQKTSGTYVFTEFLQNLEALQSTEITPLTTSMIQHITKLTMKNCDVILREILDVLCASDRKQVPLPYTGVTFA